MKRLNRSLLAATIALFAFASPLTAADHDGQRAIRYLVGTGMTGEPLPGFGLQSLCNWATVLGPTCPNEAAALNGDTIRFQGEGVLFVNPNGSPGRRMTGSGSFTHILASGGAVNGRWTAKRLLSFESWGPATEVPLPQNWIAGRAKILVLIEADGGGRNMGILDVICRLPGDAAPDQSLPEGSRLNILRMLDFPVFVFPRATLFIDLDKDNHTG